MSKKNFNTFNAREYSMKKASELFNIAKKNIKRKSIQKDDTNEHNQYCNQTFTDNKKKSNALAFSPTFVLTEMRLCLMKHDWMNLQRLFPVLLEFSNDREIVIWRYIFTIILHSPMSNLAHLKEFFRSCIGCQNDNLNCIFDQFINVISKKKKNE